MWDLVEADLMERFHVDMWAPGAWLMPWPRLVSLVEQILTVPPTRVLVPVEGGFGLQDVPQTRTQYALLKG